LSPVLHHLPAALPGYWQPMKIHQTSYTAAGTPAPHHLASHAIDLLIKTRQPD
jgi:hypothetical protein